MKDPGHEVDFSSASCSPKKIITNSLAFHRNLRDIPTPLGYESVRGAPLSFFSPTPLLIIASLSTRRFCQHEHQTGQIADEKSTFSPPQSGKRGDDPENDVEEKLGRPQRM